MTTITDEDVLAVWERGHNINAVARALGVHQQKARRLLLTAGVKLQSPLTSRINAMHNAGVSIDQIAERLGMTRNGVTAHLPYQRGPMAAWTDEEREAAVSREPVDGRSVTAQRVERSRVVHAAGTQRHTPLRRARQAARMSQRELAAASGVSVQTIRAYEQGKDMSAISLDILQMLADALHCDLKKLYEKV